MTSVYSGSDDGLMPSGWNCSNTVAGSPCPASPCLPTQKTYDLNGDGEGRGRTHTPSELGDGNKWHIRAMAIFGGGLVRMGLA